MTRPTTLAPTFSQHRKLSFLEAVDISLIPKPKAEMVSIDVGYKGGKAKTGKNKKESRLQDRENSDPAGSMGGQHNEHCDHPQIDSDLPPSPAPSELSSVDTTDSTSSNVSCSINPPVRTIIEGAEDAIVTPLRTLYLQRSRSYKEAAWLATRFP